ncbi:hypothetical protein TNCV_232131 [Trichonephila clavipes]|nr:hypothetical protein TNCV_232131 [Trichonephila clavipes]
MVKANLLIASEYSLIASQNQTYSARQATPYLCPCYHRSLNHSEFLHKFSEEFRGSQTRQKLSPIDHQNGRQVTILVTKMVAKSPYWSPKTMSHWLFRQVLIESPLKREGRGCSRILQ